MRIVRCVVSSVEDVAPQIRRVWVDHEDLPVFERIADYSVKLLVPVCQAPLLREGELDGQWRMELLSSGTVEFRTYTVAECEPGRYALDCAVHPDPGVGTQWFMSARCGQDAWLAVPSGEDGIWAPFVSVAPPQCLCAVVDDTATMALRTIMREAEYPVRAVACVAGDTAEGYVEGVEFVRRRGPIGQYSDVVAHRFVEVVRAAVGADRPGVGVDESALDNPEMIGPYLWHVGSSSAGVHVFIAGESGFVKTVRRAVLAAGLVAREQVSFMGYWKA
ncbi:siderophore-interacting protein [Corynebacterium aquilae]|nr:siderophore-interacting protein [Corynebacterium aquilae]